MTRKQRFLYDPEPIIPGKTHSPLEVEMMECRKRGNKHPIGMFISDVH